MFGESYAQVEQLKNQIVDLKQEYLGVVDEMLEELSDLRKKNRLLDCSQTQVTVSRARRYNGNHIDMKAIGVRKI